MSSNEDKLGKLIQQNAVLISLLGRLVFTPDDVKEIIIKQKRNPENYIKGYNACDGKHTMSEIAKIIDVKLGTLSPILSDWEELGIIYEVDRPKGKFYKKIFPI